MNLSDMVQLVCDDANLSTAVSTVKDRVIREINRVCEEVWNGFRWSFRWRNYRIVTDTDVTAGKVTLTNGSYTVTGAGTNFLSSHVGWHIYFTGDSTPNWYKIRAYTSPTQIELDVPYAGSGGSGLGYILRHFDYTLPTEPWDLGSVNVTFDNKIIPILEPYSMDLASPVPIAASIPDAVSIYSSDVIGSTYSTGTISGTLNTQTITGSGTLWLSNVYAGDKVTIGRYAYTVRSVDSDTQITLYQNQQVTSAAGTSYSIKRQFGRILRIFWPSVNSYTLDIRALRIYAPLVNDNDTNELFYRCSNAISLKVSALELKGQNDVRSRQLDQDAEVSLAKAKAEDESLTPREQVAPIYSYRQGRFRRWR